MAKKVVRELKLYSNSDLVDAVVEDYEVDGRMFYTIRCPDCGAVLNDKRSVDYGYDEGDEGTWFIKLCGCGIPSKYFISTVIGDRKVWTNRKPLPKKVVVTQSIKKPSFVKKPVPPVEKPKSPFIKKVLPKKKAFVESANWWET